MTSSFSSYNLPRLQDLLSTADQSPTECDGCSRLVSHFLTQRAIQHHCYQGRGVALDGKTIPPHYWVELLDQDGITWRIDYRLQLWLGADYPHGIFLPESHHPTYIPVQTTGFGGILPQALVSVLLLKLKHESNRYEAHFRRSFSSEVLY